MIPFLVVELSRSHKEISHLMHPKVTSVDNFLYLTKCITYFHDCASLFHHFQLMWPEMIIKMLLIPVVNCNLNTTFLVLHSSVFYAASRFMSSIAYSYFWAEELTAAITWHSVSMCMQAHMPQNCYRTIFFWKKTYLENNTFRRLYSL